MKYLLSYIFLVVEVFCNAQPLPDCAKTTTNKLLFIKSSENLVSDLTVGNTQPSYLDSITSCFRIDYSDVKVGLNSIYFDFKIYKNNIDYFYRYKKSKQFMHVYMRGLNFKDSKNRFYNDTFKYYLYIPKFKEGIYYIDVSKKKKIKKVICQMCIDSIKAIDITPEIWSKCSIYKKPKKCKIISK